MDRRLGALMVKQTLANSVLMIAFHFPPQRGSSGVQRTLKFARYLGGFGWKPMVLSAHPRAYANKGDEQLRDVPPDVLVERPFAIDSSRHLAVKGRYLGLLALPDRWVSWAFGAVPAGLRLVRAHRPKVIWSTYPIATAHLIGLVLHRITGLPWVADLRDPMTDLDFPRDRLLRAAYRWVEERVVRYSARVVCTTPGAVADYRNRYPQFPPSRFVLIENGYDEENFRDAEAVPLVPGGTGKGPLRLIHSGIIYPSERDPVPFFEALALLLGEGRISPESLQVLLRAPVHDDYLGALIDKYGIGSIVSMTPHVPYREALAEMLGADGLLVLQGANCNSQIPAKIYEYFRAQRPILALTDPAGDTHTTLRRAGIDTLGPLDDSDAIARALMDFLARLAAGSAPVAGPAVVQANSRHARTAQLAAVLDEVASEATVRVGALTGAP